MSVVVTLNLEYVADCVVSQLNEDEHNAFVDVQHLLSQPQYRNFVMTQSKTTPDEFAHWRPNLLRIKQEILLNQNGGVQAVAAQNSSEQSEDQTRTNDDQNPVEKSASRVVGAENDDDEDDEEEKPPQQQQQPQRRRSSRGMLMLERRLSASPAPLPAPTTTLLTRSAESTAGSRGAIRSSSPSPGSSLLVRERSSPLLSRSPPATTTTTGNSALVRERSSPALSSPVLARERSLVLDQSPRRRSQKRCVEYVGDAVEATRMHAFARDLYKVFGKYGATLRATVSTGARVDRDDPLSPRTLELLPPSSSSLLSSSPLCK